jgi:hypothetical protein
LRQPALGPHFILGQARSAARRRLTLTLGHAMRTRRFPRFVAPVVAEPSCRQRRRSAPESRHAVRQNAHCRASMQAQDAQRRPPSALRSAHDHGATRGHHIGTPARAGQFMVHASRGSAAPGSQLVVVCGALCAGGSGASCGARTSQQRLVARHNAFMPRPRHHASTVRGLTLRSTGHLAAARAWPAISFWAKHVLPQGAGYRQR